MGQPGILHREPKPGRVLAALAGHRRNLAETIQSTAADAIAAYHAEAPRDSDRRDDAVRQTPSRRCEPRLLLQAPMTRIARDGTVGIVLSSRSAKLRASGGSVLDLLDCAEDHRRSRAGPRQS